MQAVMESTEIHGKVLYEDDGHQFIWLGWEEEEEEGIVQVNQYLVIHQGVGVLLDPGGVHVFSRVVGNVARYMDCQQIQHILFSHQDPDVSSGLVLWMGVTPAKVYLSKLWGRFVPHFGHFDARRLVLLEDAGGRIPLPGGEHLQVLPAHFLHSVGNFSVWDPRARILFSGDIGAAVFPRGQRYLFVEDFARHRAFMEGFHRRYMKAQRACQKWVQRARRLNPEMIAPQHGAIFRGEDVGRFLDWLEGLRCGVDLIDEIYGRG